MKMWFIKLWHGGFNVHFANDIETNFVAVMRLISVFTATTLTENTKGKRTVISYCHSRKMSAPEGLFKLFVKS